MANAFQAEINSFHHHTAIRVQDMDTMLAFYRDTMGLPFVRQVGEGATPQVAWMQGLQLIRSDKAGDASQGTLDHLAVSVLNIEAIVERLTAQGTAMEAPIAHADFPAQNLHLDNVFFRDPEGNRVELVQWVPLR